MLDKSAYSRSSTQRSTKTSKQRKDDEDSSDSENDLYTTVPSFPENCRPRGFPQPFRSPNLVENTTSNPPGSCPTYMVHGWVSKGKFVVVVQGSDSLPDLQVNEEFCEYRKPLDGKESTFHTELARKVADMNSRKWFGAHWKLSGVPLSTNFDDWWELVEHSDRSVT